MTEDSTHKRPVRFSDDSRMAERERLAEEFFKHVLDEGETATWVSDEASVTHVSMADDQTLIDRIDKHYGVEVTSSELDLPLWHLLDLLEAARKRGDTKGTN